MESYRRKDGTPRRVSGEKTDVLPSTLVLPLVSPSCFSSIVLLVCVCVCELVCFLDNRTILLSVISLLNEPNTFSAANVDASVLYRRWHESRGKDKQYIELIR